MKIAEKVKEFFHNEGIHSTTIQPEFVELPLGGNEVSKKNTMKVDPNDWLDIVRDLAWR